MSRAGLDLSRKRLYVHVVDEGMVEVAVIMVLPDRHGSLPGAPLRGAARPDSDRVDDRGAVHPRRAGSGWGGRLRSAMPSA